MRYLTTIALALLSSSALAADDAPDPAAVRKMLGPYIKALKPNVITSEVEKKQAGLGRMLFYDRRLAATNRSCNDCHDLTKHGTNGEMVTKLREAEELFRDPPTLYNKAGLELFGWDGGFKTLKAKTTASLLSAHETGGQSEAKVVERIKAVKGYQAHFAEAFPDSSDAVTFDNAVAALVGFQKGLVAPAPIDRFVAGDDSALTDKQLRGAVLFDKHNCSACHTGSLFGGQMLQKLGAIAAWPNQADQGHYQVSKNPQHKMVFRVAPLRNVAKTAPYFHDSTSRRLWDGIRKMAWYEAGQRLDVDTVLGIQDFLVALTGEIPEDYIQEPKLPE
jgi:cytochrome c peroxidase